MKIDSLFEKATEVITEFECVVTDFFEYEVFIEEEAIDAMWRDAKTAITEVKKVKLSPKYKKYKKELENVYEEGCNKYSILFGEDLYDSNTVKRLRLVYKDNFG